MPIDRRTLLQSAALGAVGACTTEWNTEPFDPRNPEPDAWTGEATEDATRFPYAVQSGDPGPDTARFWTRYDGDGTLTLLVHLDGTVERHTVTVGDGGFVLHDLDGLTADTTYHYQFVDSDGAGSAVGRLRTALDPEQRSEVVLLGVSCCDQDRSAFPALSAALAMGPYDAMLWTGDKAYCDGSETLEEYRAVWEENYVKADIQAVHTHTAGIHTWDDHEHTDGSRLYDDNYYYQEAYDRGTEAFYEHCPVRRTEGDVLWRRLRFGQTLELFVLDCRCERDYDNEHYLSPEQLSWLLDALSDSPATWKGIVNSAPIPGWPVDPLAWDRWTGFPADRDALLQHIDDNAISGVIFLGGDYHFGGLCRVELEGPGSRQWEVFMGPGGSFLNYAAILFAGGEEESFRDWFAFAHGFWNCTRLSFSPNGTCTLSWILDDGQVGAEAVLDTDGNLLGFFDRVEALTDTGA